MVAYPGSGPESFFEDDEKYAGYSSLGTVTARDAFTPLSEDPPTLGSSTTSAASTKPYDYTAGSSRPYRDSNDYAPASRDWLDELRLRDDVGNKGTNGTGAGAQSETQQGKVQDLLSLDDGDDEQVGRSEGR
ncbi:hypothetical protein Rhopal_007537-T1 [Rhodotorula paludigena]|uniref:Uncharacterized protein n=1 Tax=Rhodotorula paludigena TaxID=86838 RepID=A0AAV5GY55_9BASI|nr:hypothetical protein Rhopal_007537-T1 [Rhodotorula paludigena]